jgi:hypothetical protein
MRLSKQEMKLAHSMAPAKVTGTRKFVAVIVAVVLTVIVALVLGIGFLVANPHARCTVTGGHWNEHQGFQLPETIGGALDPNGGPLRVIRPGDPGHPGCDY